MMVASFAGAVIAAVGKVPSVTEAFTVRTVEPVILPAVALIVVVPSASPVATPLLMIDAMAGVLLAHVTWPLRFLLLPSLRMPIAVNACVWVVSINGLAGWTRMEARSVGGGGGGPRETTKSTAESLGTDAPAAGVWLITFPAGTVGLCACVIAPDCVIPTAFTVSVPVPTLEVPSKIAFASFS